MPRDSQLLTNSQREWLDEVSEIDTGDSDERSLRSRLRSRIRDIIADSSFLTQNIPPEDLEAVFSPLDYYRRARRRSDELTDVDGAPTVVENEDEARGLDLRDGIVDLLAFLYLGVDNRMDFEQWLEQAIERAERKKGSVPVKADVGISLDREAPREYAEWWREHRGGKKHRPIPGGKWTPLMDPDVYEECGIGEMDGEELRERFGEGVPQGDTVIFDGETAFRPSPAGVDGEPEAVDLGASR